MSFTKYKKFIGIVICVIYLFYSVAPYIETKSEASTALDTYAPSVSIGQPLPQGFSILDISNFLSHVLDSAAGGVKKNLGYIWNRIVDSGYCPGTENHRHVFVYGLTSTSLTADLQQPQEGYYCYCDKCGQLAGSLIDDYIRDSNMDAEGNINVNCSLVGYGYKGGLNGTDYTIDNLYVYGNDFEVNNSIGTMKYDYKNGYNEIRFDWKRGVMAEVYGFDIEDIDYESIEFYSNCYRIKYDLQYGSDIDLSQDPPVLEGLVGSVLDGKYIVFYDAFAASRQSYRITYKYFNEPYIYYIRLLLPEESLNDNYNYDNIQAPIAYVNNGTLIYGGYSSSIVDTDTMIYTDPSTGTEYEIDSMEYDYSNNTYSLDISDFLNGVTVEFGVDGIKINENGQEKQYFYVTNPLTPVNTVTDVGTSSGLVNLDGTINLTVNQVSSTTNAYITTNEDIPQGLRALRETLATMFVELPEMTGEVTDFMQEGFSYIPQEVTTLIIFGVSVAVFVGIFKLFWR